MKKIYLIALQLLFISLVAFGQGVPQGMKYQAVARDLDGTVIANKAISLRISLTNAPRRESSKPGGELYYSETHYVRTSSLGLFDLTVGEGNVLEGGLYEVPWSENEIWMEIAIDETGGNRFVTINSSRLLAVPYAFHAGTASGLAPAEGGLRGYGDYCSTNGGVPSIYWDTRGNCGTDPTKHRLGTTDYTDLVIVTNGLERMRITAAGEINLAGNLAVGNDLTVKGNVYLNTVSGQTIVNGPLTVANMSPTHLTGTLDVDKTLNVDGATTLQSSLDVNNMAATHLTGTLDVDKTLNVDGATTLQSTLDVNNMAATHLTGTLDVDKTLNVDGATTLQSTLDVNNMAPTHLTGTLDVDKTLNVDGATTLQSSLDVNNMAPTHLTGNLDVDKTLNVDGATTLQSTLDVNNNAATKLTGTLVVDGTTTVNDNLIVIQSAPNFVASFQNTNADTGDGIIIKLGKAKTIFTPPTPASLAGDAVIKMKNLLSSGTSIGDKTTILVEVVAEGLVEDAQMIAGLAVGTGNLITGFINSQLSLPFSLSAPINSGLNLPFSLSDPINTGLSLPFSLTGPINTGLGLPAGISFLSVLNGVCDICVDDDDLPGPVVTIVPALPALAIPALPSIAIPALPSIAIPAIPAIDLSWLGVTPIAINDPAFWGVPSINLFDVIGSTPLNNDNEFIRFTDSNDSKMGSVRAVSLTNWTTNYLNPVYLYGLRSALKSAVDKNHAKYHFVGEISKALKDYASIGVEYSSGNGDYAEWLERIDIKESINPGDIVAVIGGKVTKNLTNAEQVMVVSHNPIVLGNVPPDGKTQIGNNIAFMGQVPVKVMGPVATGDYIVAEETIPGFGFAVNPNDMTIDNFKHAVGRSWVNDSSTGPKMVNTVVGIHNGDYFKILKKYEAKFMETESRFESLESKVDVLTDMLMNKTRSK